MKKMMERFKVDEFFLLTFMKLDVVIEKDMSLVKKIIE